MYIDEATRQALQSKTTEMHVGMFAQQVVSFWDLLSRRTSQRKGRRACPGYKARNVSLEQLLGGSSQRSKKQNSKTRVSGWQPLEER